MFYRIVSFFQDDFTSEDFEHMTAPLLFNMFKTKTKYPLHSAIRLKREDVVFLYLIEFNQQVRNSILLIIQESPDGMIARFTVKP